MEEDRVLLDGTDCLSLYAQSFVVHGGKLSRLMIARLYRLLKMEESFDPELKDSRRRMVYNHVRLQQDLFLHPFIWTQLVSHGLKKWPMELIKWSKYRSTNGFPEERIPELKTIVWDYAEIFRTSFSSGLPADIESLKMEIVL